MPIKVVAFNQSTHVKVRYMDQLFAVLMAESELLELPAETEVAIHMITHEKIIIRDLSLQRRAPRGALQPVEPHMIE